MAYFNFIHKTEDAKTTRDMAMDLMWSEQDNPGFDEEMCNIWGKYAMDLVRAVREYKAEIDA